MSLMMDNQDLLELMFKYLDPASVKAASLVSRFWNGVIEKPKYWLWARLSVNRYNYHEVLQSRRVNIVRRIKISVNARGANIVTNILDNLLSAVIERRSHLRSLEVVRGKGSDLLVDLTSLDRELLSQALVSLEEISLSYSICSSLSIEQLYREFIYFRIIFPDRVS